MEPKKVNDMLNSKERVRKAFANLEPDRVPVFEQEIASNVACQILHRCAYTGGWRNRVPRCRGTYVPGQKGFSDRENG